VPPDNLEILLAVKNHLSSVGSREAEMRLKLDMAEGLLNQAKRDGSRKPKEIETLLTKHEKAIETWESCRKEAPKCRASIAPLVKTFSANTRKDIEQFEADTFAYAKKADENAYWKFETGYEAATKAMDDAQKAQVSHLKLVDRNVFLANTFEFPTIMNEINKTMKSVQEDIDELRKTWATAKETREFLAASKDLMWNGIKPEELEETAKNLQKKVKLGGTKKTRSSGTVKGLYKLIKDFLQVTPLIMSLGHKSMRPRHWALLMKATKKTFTPPNEDPNMKLQNLLELGMHEFVADVEEICDQALKEEKMEETLVKLESSWKVVNWVAEPYKEGSPVNLLKIAEEDFEMLEADQLAVQGMMASRYLATFEAEVTGWQKGLAMVADVLLQLADIQRKWAYLEPLFIGSEEVRRELPEAAERFVKVDGEVRKN
jgi:dynein heavy chain